MLWRTPGERRQDYQPPGPGAMADPGTREAMAVQSAWAAMADPGTRGAMADQGILWPWPLAWLHRPWLYMPPQKNISWGSSPLGAVQEKRALWGTLDARTLGGAREATAAGESCRDSHKGP